MVDTSPIAFGTDGWRAELTEFTESRVRAVAAAIARYLTDEGLGGDPVAVGYDARPSSRRFADAAAETLSEAGHDVVVPERDCPTPLVAHAVVGRDLAGAVMITASHNPPEYNGIKFIPGDGAPALPVVTSALEGFLGGEPAATGDPGEISEVDFVGPHARAVLDLLDAEGACEGLAIGYDAIHGSGRGVTDRLLDRLGATVDRYRCTADDGFGGVEPNPTEETLEDLVTAVTAGDLDLGVANDGDADRIAVVTPDRGRLDENLLFAALYDYLLETRSGLAVRTVSTTFLIDRIAEAHGETVAETPVGFKWVGRSMAEHDALMGGEESGGFTIRGHVREKDGVIMAALTAMAHAAEPIDARVDRLLATHGTISADKVSVPCPDSRKEATIALLGDGIPDTVAGVAVDRVVTKDGFKLLLEDGSWLLVRPSGTEPKLRIYAEAESDDRVATLLSAGRDLVEPLV
ncbi:phosphoglucomutase [Halobacteriales archaeon SW_7_68_16]|nr:MAG: phosphoglucomutase [Halobacteriales archaeon SW_7_68_16]